MKRKEDKLILNNKNLNNCENTNVEGRFYKSDTIFLNKKQRNRLSYLDNKSEDYFEKKGLNLKDDDTSRSIIIQNESIEMKNTLQPYYGIEIRPGNT
jgi:hypothetical protein